MGLSESGFELSKKKQDTDPTKINGSASLVITNKMIYRRLKATVVVNYSRAIKNA